MDMEKNGACKMDRQNKKWRCAGKSGRRKNNAGTDKEDEKKLAGPLAKKLKDALEGMVNGKRFAAEEQVEEEEEEEEIR